ncbi:MAG: hypothetical protein JXK08_08015 [Flavobacteriaceae bacterium]|nr:hypothetical protein [Flavobacteriaceae bacterium]HIC32808.1 hypothetical protein [Flavobacteriaceae bacterium]
MNKFTVLILGIIITLISCDARDRINRTPKEILKEKNLLESFSERVSYFPQEYSEVKTDTILSNGYHVNVKTFTDMESSYLKQFKHDSINYKYHYRDFKAEIVASHNSIIFHDVIDKQYILKHDKAVSYYMETSILKSVWVNQEESLNQNKLVLNILFTQPKTNTEKVFELVIDNKGDKKLINLTDLNQNYLTA